jgi:hypothetical protein
MIYIAKVQLISVPFKSYFSFKMQMLQKSSLAYLFNFIQGSLPEVEGSARLSTNLYRSAPLYNEDIIYLLTKQATLTKGSNCAEPSPSVSIPCFIHAVITLAKCHRENTTCRDSSCTSVGLYLWGTMTLRIVPNSYGVEQRMKANQRFNSNASTNTETMQMNLY